MTISVYRLVEPRDGCAGKLLIVVEHNGRLYRHVHIEQ